MKYKKYKIGDVVRASERTCNVIVCSKCKKEFLLGSKEDCNCNALNNEIFLTVISRRR